MTGKKDAPELDTFRDELTERGREVWLAGLGALATVEEEGSKLFNRLIERGQEFEEERRHEIEEVTEEVTETARKQRDEALSQIEEAGEETRSALTNTVKNALERFGVPTRDEVDRLAKKVDALSQQVDDLASSLSETQEPTSENA